MNNFKKQAALTKYAPALQSQTIEEIEAMVKADEKAYAEDEVKEIMEALKTSSSDAKASSSTEGKDQKALSSDVIEPVAQGRQKTYEECKVTIIREDGKEPVIKKGEVLRTVRIEPEVAEAHNAQTLNSKIAYYEV